MIIIQNLTQSDHDKIDINSQLQHQIEKQEMKDSGWRFDIINSMIIVFYNTGETNGRSFVKILLRSNAISNVEDDDKKLLLMDNISLFTSL